MAGHLPGFLKMFETEFPVRAASSFGDSFVGSVTYAQTSPGGLAIYGKYCGPGNGDPTGNTLPVDAVDAVCRAHDLCYQANGFFTCNCDCALLRNMPLAIENTSTAQGKAAGKLVANFFATFPCIPNLPP
jgi:hypothetical protein